MMLRRTPTMSGVLQTLRGMGATQDQLATINALYQQELGRTADSGGLQYWANFIDSGYTFNDIAAGIANSPEYQQRVSAPPPPVVMPTPVAPVITQLTQPLQTMVPTTTQLMTTAQPTQTLLPMGPTAGNNSKTILLAGLAVGAVILLKRKSQNKNTKKKKQ